MNDHPRDPVFQLTDPGRTTHTRLAFLGGGLDTFDLFALIRDVFLWRLTRGKLHSLIFETRRVLERLDYDRDRLFGGPPERVLSYDARCWLEGVKTEDNPEGHINKIRPIKEIRAWAREEHGYEMSLVEAKEYVEAYQKRVEFGQVPPIRERDQRPLWMHMASAEGATVDELISSNVKKMLDSNDEDVRKRGFVALQTKMLWPDREVEAFIRAYDKAMGRKKVQDEQDC